MKEPLERTAILCKDVLEQDPEGEARFIVMLLESNVTLAADHVIQDDREVTVMCDGQTVASFSPAVAWLKIRRDRVDVITRADQIRRHYANAAAEKGLTDSLGTEQPKAEQPIGNGKPHDEPSRRGYL